MAVQAPGYGMNRPVAVPGGFPDIALADSGQGAHEAGVDLLSLDEGPPAEVLEDENRSRASVLRATDADEVAAEFRHLHAAAMARIAEYCRVPALPTGRTY